MARATVTVPPTAQRGDLLEIRTLIVHPMHPMHPIHAGLTADAPGRELPRDIVTRFECRYNDELVFAADLSPAIAADPYLAFYTVATDSGTLAFSWHGDNGFVESATASITVT